MIQGAEVLIFKIISPYIKLIFSIGGWFASLLIQFVSPEEISRKEMRYRLVSSIISVPIVMSIDSHFNLNKWIVSLLSILFGLFGWLVIDIAKKKAPKKFNDYINKFKV